MPSSVTERGNCLCYFFAAAAGHVPQHTSTNAVQATKSVNNSVQSFLQKLSLRNSTAADVAETPSSTPASMPCAGVVLAQDQAVQDASAGGEAAEEFPKDPDDVDISAADPAEPFFDSWLQQTEQAAAALSGPSTAASWRHSSSSVEGAPQPSNAAPAPASDTVARGSAAVQDYHMQLDSVLQAVEQLETQLRGTCAAAK